MVFSDLWPARCDHFGSHWLQSVGARGVGVQTDPNHLGSQEDRCPDLSSPPHSNSLRVAEE